jgi:F-type H+-transporting ATPase subunit delta
MKSNNQAKREAKQLLRICVVNRWPDEKRIRQVAQYITTAGRRGGSLILKHFWRLLRLREAQRTAVIESAMPLPADLQGVLEKGLVHRYGPGLITTFTQRPALIGGLRIQVGCDVYDGSVRAGLAALDKSF